MLNNKIFRNIVLVVVIVIILGWVYNYFTKDDSVESLLQVTTNEESDLGSDIVSQLAQLRSLSLEGRFFSDPLFVSLKDWSSDIPKFNVGRPNPFAPFGQSTNVGTTTQR